MKRAASMSRRGSVSPLAKRPPRQQAPLSRAAARSRHHLAPPGEFVVDSLLLSPVGSRCVYNLARRTDYGARPTRTPWGWGRLQAQRHESFKCGPSYLARDGTKRFGPAHNTWKDARLVRDVLSRLDFEKFRATPAIRNALLGLLSWLNGTKRRMALTLWTFCSLVFSAPTAPGCYDRLGPPWPAPTGRAVTREMAASALPPDARRLGWAPCGLSATSTSGRTYGNANWSQPQPNPSKSRTGMTPWPVR